jgi:hypothetical protein
MRLTGNAPHAAVTSSALGQRDMTGGSRCLRAGHVRRARRVDANQAQIVAALRAAGCTVEVLSDVGRGVPDLLVGIRGRNLLVEVKDGSLPPSRRRLTDDELAWHARWRGAVVVVHDVHEAIAILT